MTKITETEGEAMEGFYYDVTDEQVRQHQQRSIEEIFEWIETTSIFIWQIQTPEERRRKFDFKGNKYGDYTEEVIKILTSD